MSAAKNEAPAGSAARGFKGIAITDTNIVAEIAGGEIDTLVELLRRHLAASKDNRTHFTLLANPPMLETYARGWLATVRQHGVFVPDRMTAAAHEAGHAVVAAALGAQIKSLRVFQQGEAASAQVWGGMYYMDRSANLFPEDMHQPRYYSIESMTDGAMLRRALTEQAGIAGEQVRECWHPSSSLDESVVSSFVACTLAARHSVDPVGFVGGVCLLAREIIARNRDTHELLIDALMHSERPPRAQLQHLCRRVGLADLSAVFEHLKGAT